MNMTHLPLSAMLLLVTLLLGACGQAPVAGQEVPATTVAPVEAADSDASAGTTITVGTDDDAALTFVPRMVEAPANTSVTLIFNNTSTQPHNLQIPPPIKAKTKLVVAAGTLDTITFTTSAPGSIRFLCTFHEYMTGTLQVK